MVRVHETSYRTRLSFEAILDVRFLRQRNEVIDYVVVLLVQEGGVMKAVRVYDNTHGDHDMHRYNRDGVSKLPRRFIEDLPVRRCAAR